MSSKEAEIIQYVPFMSFVHPSFWHTLTELKLDVDKLNERTKEIHGRFTYRDDIGSEFEVDGTSFNKIPDSEQYCVNVTGTLMNKNTIEDFKSIDKAGLLNSVGEIMWSNTADNNWIKNPSSLLNFFILSYANLKKFHYYYWFAFPAPSQPTVYIKEKSASITKHFSNRQIDDLKIYRALDNTQKCFFIVTKIGDNLILNTLAHVIGNGITEHEVKVDMVKTYFVFLNPSNGTNPGWPLRLYLAAMLEYCPALANYDIKVVGLRCTIHGSIENSSVYTIRVPQDVRKVHSAGWVGWERNDKGNFGPKLANMATSMDPVVLADTSADLNLKLMKWRLVPYLDVEVMKSTKCLLLGAGTLGCHVAQNLLAWGFRHISFIDNGKVSYSNPTRQVLYNYRDCLNGGRRKAEAAAENLKHILPTVKSIGVAAHIPMPGHPVGDSMREETIQNVQLITEAIMNHDVIFLLLDTREARWLPTVLAAHHEKMVINAALGFDSYLVMRHGTSVPTTVDLLESPFIPGMQLGCYFCNDVTAPGNSLKDRTLDQQCTVTRPGSAAIAGALAVELLVGMLQHPLRVDAPALYNFVNDSSDPPPEMEGVLGPVPHSIRGFLHSYQAVLPTCSKFKQCIACSTTILNLYKNEGINFLLKVFDSANYLEEVTGLTELQLTAEMSDILTLSEDDDD